VLQSWLAPLQQPLRLEQRGVARSDGVCQPRDRGSEGITSLPCIALLGVGASNHRPRGSRAARVGYTQSNSSASLGAAFDLSKSLIVPIALSNTNISLFD